MVLAAFQTYDRGQARESFLPAATLRDAAPVSFVPLSADKPGPHKTQSEKVAGAGENVDRTIRTAFADQQKAINDNGLADKQTAKLGDVLSPADLLLPGAALTMISVVGYALADRRSSKEPTPQVLQTPSEEFRRVQWNRPGYHAAPVADDNDSMALTAEQVDALLRPLQQDTRMRVLMAQQRSIKDARSNLGVREDKGLKVNRQTLGAALEQDATGWLYQSNHPAPHFV